MELYNRGDNASTRNIRPSNKIPSTRDGLHLIESLIKGVPQTDVFQKKKPQSIAKAIG